MTNRKIQRASIKSKRRTMHSPKIPVNRNDYYAIYKGKLYIPISSVMCPGVSFLGTCYVEANPQNAICVFGDIVSTGDAAETTAMMCIDNVIANTRKVIEADDVQENG